MLRQVGHLGNARTGAFCHLIIFLCIYLVLLVGQPMLCLINWIRVGKPTKPQFAYAHIKYLWSLTVVTCNFRIYYTLCCVCVITSRRTRGTAAEENAIGKQQLAMKQTQLGYHEQKTSNSDVLRIHILYVMDTFSTCHERKPRLHDGTVTEDTDKYRLVRIPPSSREPPVVGLTRIRKAPS